MFVYFSMILWAAVCGLVSSGSESTVILEGKKEKRTNYFFAFITMAYIIFFLGAFNGFFDLPAYDSGYRSLPSEPSEIAEYMDSVEKYPGFFYLQVIFKVFVTPDFYKFNFCLIAFDLLAIMYLYRRYSCNYAFSMFLFLAAGKFTWPINGVKQFLATCITIAFCKFLMEKKFIPFAIGVLIASTFHTTALIMLPVYFFVHGKPWNKKMLLILAGSVLATIFVSNFTGILEKILEETSYDTSVLEGDNGSNFLRVLIAAVPAVIALISRKRIENTAPKYINVCINMSLVTACTYLVASFTSGIHMGRIPIYFELYSFISLPWLLENAFDKETSKTVKLACVICYLILYYLINWKTPYYSKLLNIYITP